MVTGDQMAKILAFRTGELKRGEGSLARKPPGEVILFPGVRYERWHDEATGASRDASTRRDTRQERDILELAE